MSELETRLTREPAEIEALAAIVGWAFGNGTHSAHEWLRRAELGSVRVAGRRAELEGGLVEIGMGQWFGGRRVPTLGIAGVAIAAEARGQGLGLALMRATLRSARERGFALSTLYPSTYGLYRKAGYELAGSLCRFTLQLRQLPRSPRPLAVQVLTDARLPAVDALYRRVAQRRPGYLDRGAYVWNRVRNPEREPARGFGVEGPDGLSGYVYVRAATSRTPLELLLSDFVVQSPAALRAALAFLADHSTIAERVGWNGGPADARLLGLPDRSFKVGIEEYWMLRLIDVPAALLARGYPEVDVAVDLELDDEVLPENGGIYPLRVTRGVAALGADGAAPRARLSVSALAALYSGFLGPFELELGGQLQADERAMAALAALFGGPAPAMVDYF